MSESCLVTLSAHNNNREAFFSSYFYFKYFSFPVTKMANLGYEPLRLPVKDSSLRARLADSGNLKTFFKIWDGVLQANLGVTDSSGLKCASNHNIHNIIQNRKSSPFSNGPWARMASKIVKLSTLKNTCRKVPFVT